MLERLAKPVFIALCACNLALSIRGVFEFEGLYVVTHLWTLLIGGLAFIIAAVLALVILRGASGPHRPWIKAALVFLVLGPIAFWSLQNPAAIDTICLAGHRCLSEASITYRIRAMGDVIQSQWAMIAVALAALFCATRASVITFDELAA